MRSKDHCGSFFLHWVLITKVQKIIIVIIIMHNTSARQLLSDLGRRISENSGETREASFFISKMFGARATFQRHTAS